MALLELLEEKIVKIPLKAKNKKDTINELVKILKKSGKIKDTKIILKDLFKREELSSTGLGGGIAIPHAKTSAVDTLILAIGIAPKGIDFESLDGSPSNLFFLILTPLDQAAQHLQMLSEIASITKDKDFLQAIIKSASPAEIVKLFLDNHS